MPVEWVDDNLRLVRETVMFKGLAPALVDEILSDCQIEEHPAGARLFNQGEPARAFFIVLDGWVKV